MAKEVLQGAPLAWDLALVFKALLKLGPSVAEAAERYDVGHFILISTDKAVNPSSVMGAEGPGELGSRGAEGQGMIRGHEELEVYRLAFETAMRIFDVSKGFPREELYSLTDQIRRSSCSVCSNIAEAWRKRRYAAAFASKLNDAESEAAESQTWLRFAMECGYLSQEAGKPLRQAYDRIIGKLVHMIFNPTPWILPKGS